MNKWSWRIENWLQIEDVIKKMNCRLFGIYSRTSNKLLCPKQLRVFGVVNVQSLPARSINAKKHCRAHWISIFSRRLVIFIVVWLLTIISSNSACHWPLNKNYCGLWLLLSFPALSGLLFFLFEGVYIFYECRTTPTIFGTWWSLMLCPIDKKRKIFLLTIIARTRFIH